MTDEPLELFQHLLQVPVEGIFHLYHSETRITDEYVALVLTTANDAPTDGEDRPVPARIEVNLDNREDATIWFVPDPRLDLNVRARNIAADAFGWHMVFHGAVLFRGLSETQVTAYIELYG